MSLRSKPLCSLAIRKVSAAPWCRRLGTQVGLAAHTIGLYPCASNLRCWASVWTSAAEILTLSLPKEEGPAP